MAAATTGRCKDLLAVRGVALGRLVGGGASVGLGLGDRLRGGRRRLGGVLVVATTARPDQRERGEDERKGGEELHASIVTRRSAGRKRGTAGVRLEVGHRGRRPRRSRCLAEARHRARGWQRGSAAAKPTPSGVCPAVGGDQAAGFRSAESCSRTSQSSRTTVAPSAESDSWEVTSGCRASSSLTALRIAPVPRPWMTRTSSRPASAAVSTKARSASRAS